jgi:hypothetical protein
VHHKSALPKHSKVNIIRNERKRINQRCSTEATTNKHNSNLDGVLRLNGYPEEVINESYRTEPPNHRQPRQINNPNWLYLKIPYISDSIDYKIKTLFKNEGFPIRITRKSTTLRQVLRSENHNPSSCNKSECATSSANLCFAKNVVYRITCTQCKQCYIGSTIRNLHDRTKEHLSKPASSVYKHFTNNHDTENISSKVTIAVIAKERDPVNLRLKEAFYIRKQKPDINSREERSELTELLF